MIGTAAVAAIGMAATSPVRAAQRRRVMANDKISIVCQLVNVAYLSGETVHFSKAKMDILGKSGKETISYNRPYCKPWILPMYPI